MKTVQPTEVIPTQRPPYVWVYEKDGEATNVRSPKIDGDTLRGVDATLGEPFAVALSDVKQVRALQPDHTKTRILVAGSAVIGTAAIVAFLASTGHQNAMPCQGNLAIESECNVTTYGPNGNPNP